MHTAVVRAVDTHGNTAGTDILTQREAKLDTLSTSQDAWPRGRNAQEYRIDCRHKGRRHKEGKRK